MCSLHTGASMLLPTRLTVLSHTHLGGVPPHLWQRTAHGVIENRPEALGLSGQGRQVRRKARWSG